jgi:hypothetical protein
MMEAETSCTRKQRQTERVEEPPSGESTFVERRRKRKTRSGV